MAAAPAARRLLTSPLAVQIAIGIHHIDLTAQLARPVTAPLHGPPAAGTALARLPARPGVQQAHAGRAYSAWCITVALAGSVDPWPTVGRVGSR